MGCQVKEKLRDLADLNQLYPQFDALPEKFSASENGTVVGCPMQKDACPTQLLSMGEGKGALGLGAPLELGNRYCTLIASLLYIANITKPDSAQSMGVLSRYRCT